MTTKVVVRNLLGGLVGLLLLFAPVVCPGASRPLQFVKKIGGPTVMDGWMSYVAFSPGGTMIAGNGQVMLSRESSATTNPGFAVWRFPGGKFIRLLPFEVGEIAPNWRYFISKGTVRSMASGRVALAPGAPFVPETFGAGSRLLAETALSVSASPAIRVVALPGDRRVAAFGRHIPRALAFSPDGRLLAAGYWDMVVLWDVHTGKRVATLRGVGRYVYNLSFSGNGRLLGAGTDSGGLLIWNVRHRRRLMTLRTGGLEVSRPAFSPDGRLAAVGDYARGTVWLVDISRRKIIDSRQVSDHGCGAVAFSPDGRFLIAPSTGGLITWPYDQGGSVRVFRVRAP